MKISITDEFLWDIYKLLEATGDVTRFLLDPNPMKFMPGPKNPAFTKYHHDKNKRKFENLIYYAKRKGLITIKKLEGKKAIMLTREGLSKALKTSFVMEGKKKRADGKWMMVIFDVPEKNRKSRDLLRSILHNLGFKIFQQSAWITPYDVSEKLEKSLQMYSLDNYVKIFLIEEI